MEEDERNEKEFCEPPKAFECERCGWEILSIFRLPALEECPSCGHREIKKAA